jgi:hypothetical protein
VAVQSKTCTVFARSNTWIMGSNPTWGMEVSMLLFCVQVETLRLAIESFWLCEMNKKFKTRLMFRQRIVEPWMNEWMNVVLIKEGWKKTTQFLTRSLILVEYINYVAK